ncbi:esterase family protein [Neobacillus notoginsengisoli]|uniref:Esterase family protein n=1 Tax=Neobacillus notoginsengisoli TaxID=1578198 RepID=A0A417YZC1_9BACI|nr:alpha/beta hydrolase-fold protein [Neobacillus notoginsengisoli]RHW43250.1 esterase family protein [Neobacillus notoginsengisoli]
MEFARGTVNEVFFDSKELGESVQLLIHLPATFSPLYKYSLLITQDGDDYFRLGRIGTLADELLAKKEIENVIIVGIPYKDAQHRRSTYHPKGEKHSAYIRFLAHELVPYLDREYPTYQMGATRALAGDSLAGTVSLLTALSYPHTFGKVLIQSPYVNEAVQQAVEKYKENLPIEIYHSVGKNEHAAELVNGKTADFLTPNRELAGVLSAKPFRYTYHEFDGDHTWTHWQPDLRAALKALF